MDVGVGAFDGGGGEASARYLPEARVNGRHVGEYAAVVGPIAHHEHVADLEQRSDLRLAPL